MGLATGDSQETAESIAAILGIDHVFTGFDMRQLVCRAQQEGKRVAYVGYFFC